MGAAKKNQGKAAYKRLLPQDLLGKRFFKWFNHGYGVIEAKVPEIGKRVEWRTLTGYPEKPCILWDKYLSKELLVGVRFDGYTNYGLIDIDIKSQYHPKNDLEAYKGVLWVLEKIGLCRVIAIRSSSSGGIHLYFFMPDEVHSFTLGATIERVLEEGGFVVKAGQLEIFPNAKGYGIGNVINFSGHRLPLQVGSYILDSDFNPVSNDLKEFLEMADLSAEGQDMEALGQATRESLEWIKKRKYKGGKMSGEEFERDLLRIIEIGWTGYHQTNEKLLTMGAYGIVFAHETGEGLVRWMLKTTLNCPGYYEYCRHQHEIEKRCREVARSAEKFQYVPYYGTPNRDKSYREHFYGQEEGKKPHPSKLRREETLDRIKAVVGMLKGGGNFPTLVEERIKAIIKKSREAFEGLGTSKGTLYKDEYLSLWHPEHEGKEPVKISAVSTWEVLKEYKQEPLICAIVELARIKGSLQVESGYEGICMPSLEGGENQGSNQVEGETSHSEGEIIGQGFNLANVSEDIVLFCSIFLQIFSIQGQESNTGNNFNSSSNQSITLNSSNSLIQINSNPDNSINSIFNSLMSLINTNELNSKSGELINQFKVLLDKLCLYLGSGEARRQKVDFEHKQNLSLLAVSQPVTSSECKSECNSANATTVKPCKEGCDSNKDFSLDELNQVPYSRIFKEFSSQQESNTELSGEDSSQPYRQAISLKLKVIKEAKKLVHRFCKSQGIALSSKLRQLLEQLLKNNLFQRSPSAILKQEAIEWFATHREEIAQVNNLDIFWNYFGDLVF
jgi:hypothetical protein